VNHGQRQTCAALEHGHVIGSEARGDRRVERARVGRRGQPPLREFRRAAPISARIDAAVQTNPRVPQMTAARSRRAATAADGFDEALHAESCMRVPRRHLM
jgi:hypothetical protein